MITNAVIVGANVTPAQYNAETAQRGDVGLVVRSHILSEVLRNAQRWIKGYESPESKAKKYGALWDCLLLTPMQWPERYCVVPADAPRRPSSSQRNAKKPSPATLEAIAWWDAWAANNPGEIVSADLNGAAHAAITRLREDKLIAGLIDCSQHQVMIVAEWHDGPTGLKVPLKCLLDVLPGANDPIFANSIWDTKTTMNAAPYSFARDAQKYRYDLQAALYLDMHNAATGEIRSDFGHIVQENYHPYEYRTPPPLMTQRFINFGRQSYQRALNIYCKALASGVWPSYDGRSKDWPVTECDDWFLAMDGLYDPFGEPAEDETEAEAAPEEKEDLIP